jgi:hypothetical protein
LETNHSFNPNKVNKPHDTSIIQEHDLARQLQALEFPDVHLLLCRLKPFPYNIDTGERLLYGVHWEDEVSIFIIVNLQTIKGEVKLDLHSIFAFCPVKAKSHFEPDEIFVAYFPENRPFPSRLSILRDLAETSSLTSEIGFFNPDS